MPVKYSNKKTQRFYFMQDGDETSLVLIYSDEIETMTGASFKGAGYVKVKYRGRIGALKRYASGPALMDNRALETYFLDVGQGDAAFIVTPNNTKILVDGGITNSTAEFLIWKYRLDRDGNTLTIDHLFLSHADQDHVKGLIPILLHDKITVKNVWHNGLGQYSSGFNQKLGQVENDILLTSHDTLEDLNGQDLTRTFRAWTDAVKAQGASYRALQNNMAPLDIGDPDIAIEIVGPRREPDGTFEWFNSHSHTINGHSLMFRLVYNHTRFMFSGDINIQGGKHQMEQPGAGLRFDSHVLKSPHHGSHEFHYPFLRAVRPLISVVSSGDSPDHGHPRASFLGALGRAGRSEQHLLFSTEIAATFGIDRSNPIILPETAHDADPSLRYSDSLLNREARTRFIKKLSGIINVRSNGRELYAARRVTASYQWESYEPIDVTEFG